MAHIVLLGDSIFDNAPYVSCGMDVRAQLQSLLDRQHRVSLLAQDGSVLADMAAQVGRQRNYWLHGRPASGATTIACST